jgi:dihydropteroate synthase
MVAEGATVLDIGGASSRPAGATYGKGAERVSPTEELDRILPVIEALAVRLPGVPLSVDTFEPAVAEAALAAGAHLVNDITGLRHSPELADVARKWGAPLILMHSVGSAGALAHQVPYTDVVSDVVSALSESVDIARRRGVSQLVVDPGFGFGKKPQDNLRLLARLDQLLALGLPVLVGVSRKSTIGVALADPERLEPYPVEARLFGSLGATAAAVVQGASMVRTHDVAETAQMIRVLTRTLTAGGERSGPIPYHAEPPPDSL